MEDLVAAQDGTPVRVLATHLLLSHLKGIMVVVPVQIIVLQVAVVPAQAVVVGLEVRGFLAV
jgi:hypothetical protein